MNGSGQLLDIRSREASQMLAYAEAATNINKFDDALVHYQAYLQIMMEMYKTVRDESAEKKLILKKIEEKMAIAEVIKQRIAAQKAEEELKEEQRKQLEIDKKQQSSGGIFSIFSWSNSSSSSSKPTEVKSSSGAKKKGAVPLPPDQHDYTAVRNTVATAVKANNAQNRNTRAATVGAAPSSSSSAARSTATPSTAAIAATARQQVASVQRLHSGQRGPQSQSQKAAVATTSGRAAAAASAVGKMAVDAANSIKRSVYEVQILEEMLDASPSVQWDDIAGLQLAKQTLQEAVILPNLRPDLFTGLRSPPKGVLLFGPPGTGKTLLAKAVATVSGFSFFSISASSVTSKYMGEGEKLMRALFDVARQRQPAVIFFDEIDALMSARKENEHEASRRLKTEFMTQVDGATTNAEERLLIMAATNIPWEIDEAVLRRMTKRIYIPLPDDDSRRALVQHLLKKQGPDSKPLTVRQLDKIVKITAGYSGSDLTALCHEAALGPIRELGPDALLTIRAENIRGVNEQDFSNAIKNIRPSVSPENIAHFSKWSDQYGVGK